MNNEPKVGHNGSGDGCGVGLPVLMERSRGLGVGALVFRAFMAETRSSKV